MYLITKGITSLYFLFFIVSYQLAYANSSFDDLVSDVAQEASISRVMARDILLTTFKVITDRMQEDKGTSIPDFGRFYVQEKQKPSGVDKDGFTTAPRMIRTPRCTMSKELRNILEK